MNISRHLFIISYMDVLQTISMVFSRAERIPINENSKFIFFSDCHRGDGSWADDFADNKNIFYHALSHYYNNGFTYIELGDGDELWKNSHFSVIREAHSNVFKLLVKFHESGRLYIIFGNHDIERANSNTVKNTMEEYYSRHKDKYETLFYRMRVYESIVLKNSENNRELFLLHGHQADTIHNWLWHINRFMTRRVLRYLQLFGIKDPTSPAVNKRKRARIERLLSEWARVNNTILIAGHTHKPLFPTKDEPQYYNTGSCVHPRCITGIELENSQLTLVKWSISAKTDGCLFVEKDILEGPLRISKE